MSTQIARTLEDRSTAGLERVDPERDTAPQCPTHKRSMLPRDDKLSSAEQRWCGKWWDCTVCTNSVLQPSAELAAHLDAQKKPAQMSLRPA